MKLCTSKYKSWELSPVATLQGMSEKPQDRNQETYSLDPIGLHRIDWHGTDHLINDQNKRWGWEFLKCTRTLLLKVSPLVFSGTWQNCNMNAKPFWALLPRTWYPWYVSLLLLLGRLRAGGGRRGGRQWCGFEVKLRESCSVMFDSLQSPGLSSPWDSPGQNTGVGSCSLLQGIFPTKGSNPGLTHCRQIFYQLSHQGSPVWL